MKHFPLFKVHVPVDDSLENIKKVFLSGFINEGTEVTQLTQKMQQRFETENLILLNSCTSALTLSLKLAGITPLDTVVSTPMTCVATNTPIVSLGAKIVWADVDPNHGMVTPKTVEEAIDISTKAVMVVCWAGTPPDLEGIRKVCDEHGVKMILDAAHAFDARYKGKQIHEFADYTCYSFQAIKHFTTGDGGALICKDDDDYRRSKALKWFGLDRDHAKDEKGNWKGQQWDVDIIEPGFKYNMNNVSAAIGLAQFPYIDNVIKTHKENASLYDELFKASTSIKPTFKIKEAESSFWVYPMQVTDSCRYNRDELLKILNAEGIMAGVVHVPNDDYSCFKEFQSVLPGVRSFSNTQFNLPCGWWLSQDNIRYIAKRVLEIIE